MRPWVQTPVPPKNKQTNKKQNNCALIKEVNENNVIFRYLFIMQ
jgi:hypothetical protein